MRIDACDYHEGRVLETALSQYVDYGHTPDDVQRVKRMPQELSFCSACTGSGQDAQCLEAFAQGMTKRGARA